MLMEQKVFLDPVHKTLRDSQGRVLKVLNCPQLALWQDLAVIANQEDQHRFCGACGKLVIDTEQWTAGRLVRAVRDDPEACLRIRVGQGNVEIKVSNE